MISIELILIGNELLNGKTQDLNTHHIGQLLAQHGLCLYRTHTIPDSLAELEQLIQVIKKRSDVILTTGGLGPTGDDVTKYALAKIFQCPLEESQKALAVATQNYANLEKIPRFTENNYHTIPRGFTPLPNPKGLAPGLVYHFPRPQQGNGLLVAMPGVPHECQAMFEFEVLPLLQQSFQFSRSKATHTSIRTWGVPEEKIFFDLCPTLWDDLSQWGVVSCLPQNLGVDIHITYSLEDKKEQIQKEAAIVGLLEKSALAPHIWQVGNLRPQAYLLQLCRQKNLKLATAESCTGGKISSLLTDVPGASENFMGSIISYHNLIKENLLGVSSETLQQHGAVSEATAIEMVRGVARQLQADFAISTTGIAGPSGGSEAKPVGSVWIALFNRGKTSAHHFKFKGDRELLKSRFTHLAMYLAIENISAAN